MAQETSISCEWIEPEEALQLVMKNGKDNLEAKKFLYQNICIEEIRTTARHLVGPNMIEYVNKIIPYYVWIKMDIERGTGWAHGEFSVTIVETETEWKILGAKFCKEDIEKVLSAEKRNTVQPNTENESKANCDLHAISDKELKKLFVTLKPYIETDQPARDVLWKKMKEKVPDKKITRKRVRILYMTLYPQFCRTGPRK